MRRSWRVILSLLCTLAAVLCWAPDVWAIGRDCRVGWDAPTTNDNGTPLTDLAGYKVYTSTTAGSYGAATLTVSSTTTIVTCNALGLTVPNQAYFMRVTAFDSSVPANESLVSNELSLTITTGPIGQWPLHEISCITAADMSGFNQSGTTRSATVACGNPPTAGCPSWTGAALTLDGTNDDVRIARTTRLEPYALTACATAVRSGTQAAYADMLNKTWQNDGSPTYTSYEIQSNVRSLGSDFVSFTTGHAGTFHSLDSPSGTLVDGVPAWICATYNPDAVAPQKRLYKNGSQINSATLTSPLVYDASSTGDLYFGTNGAGRAWRGSLSGVRIYEYAMTPAEIAALYTLAPKRPTSPQATLVSATQINLTWVAPTQSTDNSILDDLRGYRVTYCISPGCTPSTDLPDLGVTTTFSHTGLTRDRIYRYKVRALDWQGNLSADSTIVQADTTDTPKAPTNLTAAGFSQSQINLTWTAPTQNTDNTSLVDLAGYRIYQCRLNLCTPVFYASVGLVTSYSNTGLQSNSLYNYQIAAVDTSGIEGPKTAVVSGTTLGGARPIATHYRWYKPGTPEGTTLEYTEDQSALRIKSDNGRVRLRVGIANATGLTVSTITALECSKNGGAFTMLSNSCSPFGLCIGSCDDPNGVGHNGDTRSLLTVPPAYTFQSGAFVAGDISGSWPSRALQNQKATDFEFLLQVNAAQGTTFDCRPVQTDGAAYDSYPSPLPRLTVGSGSQTFQ